MKLQDLKRGMKCTFRNGINKIIDTVRIEPNILEFLPNKQGTKATYFSFNEDLINENNTELDILKVEDITENGYEVIWEREEPKYYLRLPEPLKHVCTYLNLNVDTGTYGLADKEEIEGYRTKFTQDEIDELPSQEFIKNLIKEEVKE